MTLPDFDASGDLPPGVHRATLNEVIQRFSSAGGQRGVCTLRLSHVYELAQRTGQLQRFIIFGSYVTTQPNPNDIDVVLVMDDTFRLEESLSNLEDSLNMLLPRQGTAPAFSGYAPGY